MSESKKDLLIELFSEEIPARMQADAARDLARLMEAEFKEAGLTYGEVSAFAGPRRLTLSVKGLPASTPDISEERRGPKVGAPEQALMGFCRGAGVEVADLVERDEKKGTFYYAIIEKSGCSTTEVIAEALEKTIRNFPWPKSQRWGAGDLKWVRPLANILCILDGETVDVSVDHLTANTKTFGHRFLSPEWFTVTDFDDYEAKLKDHKVVVSVDDRMAVIEEGIQKLASEKGLEWIEDKGLLAEVAGLVEWPVPLLGSFDPSFLEVPEEVLILTMKKDQKYFVLRDPKTGKLAPNFITVSNIEATDGGVAVAAGNQRVIAARLADAKFFWEQDLKGKLDDNLDKLKDIIFHIDLGTVADRVERITALSGHLAQYIDGCDKAEAERAAQLIKADLTSNMVNEFASLQGVMGRYYAMKQGETLAVADAIRDHYAPAGPNDACPSAPVSVAVALAEKLDTLIGFFGIDQKPTGSKDPFALRRAALGIIRLITENDLRIPLRDIFNNSRSIYLSQKVNIGEVTDDLLAFFADRLKVQQKEKGVRHDLIAAVSALGGDDLVDILNRVAALQDFIGADDGVNLLAGYKRASNILKKSKDDIGAPQAGLLVEDAEKSLYQALAAMEKEVEILNDSEDYAGVMAVLANLRAPIDAFFEGVMVNADDADVRANRLALLASFTDAVNKVADFNQIEG